jgi:hypothetical protein
LLAGAAAITFFSEDGERDPELFDLFLSLFLLCDRERE